MAVFYLILLCFISGSTGQSYIPQKCDIVNKNVPCVCKDERGNYVDLRPLTNKNFTARYLDITAATADGHFYSYNPCYGFNEKTTNDTSGCIGVASCRVSHDKMTFQDIGVHRSAFYSHFDNGNLSLNYKSADGERHTIVSLYCDYNASEGYLRVVGDMGGFYWFQLRSVHSCPKTKSEISDINSFQSSFLFKGRFNKQELPTQSGAVRTKLANNPDKVISILPTAQDPIIKVSQSDLEINGSPANPDHDKTVLLRKPNTISSNMLPDSDPKIHVLPVLQTNSDSVKTVLPAEPDAKITMDIKEDVLPIELNPVITDFPTKPEPVKTVFPTEPNPVKTVLPTEPDPVKTVLPTEPDPVKTVLPTEPVKTVLPTEPRPVKTVLPTKPFPVSHTPGAMTMTSAPLPDITTMEFLLTAILTLIFCIFLVLITLVMMKYMRTKTLQSYVQLKDIKMDENQYA